MRRVKINRGDPRRGAGPFAGLVTGDADQLTPNGCAYSETPTVPEGPMGAYVGNDYQVKKGTWDGGNRSGE